MRNNATVKGRVVRGARRRFPRPLQESRRGGGKARSARCSRPAIGARADRRRSCSTRCTVAAIAAFVATGAPICAPGCGTSSL